MYIICPCWASLANFFVLHGKEQNKTRIYIYVCVHMHARYWLHPKSSGIKVSLVIIKQTIYQKSLDQHLNLPEATLTHTALNENTY
jgi:hypothetical protein